VPEDEFSSDPAEPEPDPAAAARRRRAAAAARAAEARKAAAIRRRAAARARARRERAMALRAVAAVDSRVGGASADVRASASATSHRLATLERAAHDGSSPTFETVQRAAAAGVVIMLIFPGVAFGIQRLRRRSGSGRPTAGPDRTGGALLRRPRALQAGTVRPPPSPPARARARPAATGAQAVAAAASAVATAPLRQVRPEPAPGRARPRPRGRPEEDGVPGWAIIAVLAGITVAVALMRSSLF
jgi:hypothetical protein